ncbi:hypothetical protein K1I36_01020 [Corynebacterium silvaticum]|uniref:hypothetical protein n=1 Tax=Corynebacterium silvaticum TaxID=2320431 RepID=UPI0014198A69|nr:hypothetical protein [Corynebacterium silvaticum]MBH5301156.1 hypothetical protein [Corynebacterium silvaticum]NOM65356.1 hypothetical protein [Corynebacterium silvaticum]NON70994.1 hypothetical protein [Corynebacterium silvaticum]UWH00434.1 hypothetical protein K1I39_01010 [Corynebacterium silvaticum]UWH02482.1 hypothetical protein K1I38_01015 [Corynebacterium silvaticum]
MQSTAKVDDLRAGVTINIHDTKFRLGVRDCEVLLKQLDGADISAEARLNIEQLLAGKETSLAELEALSAQVADPKTKLVLDQLIADKKTALDNLNEVAKQKTEPTISADNKPLQESVKESKNWLGSIKDKVVTIHAKRVMSWLGGNAEGGLAGFATGGRLPVYGPGTDRVDGILGVGSDGMPVARVDAGEWVINRKSSERYHDILAQINAGTYPAYAAGGLIKSAAEIKKAIQFMHGTPYLMGGWSPAATDCSGAVSGTINVALGAPFFDSRMSTVTEGTWLDARGALPGRGSTGDISVGWWD